MKIFQTSDIHLGCRRMGGRLPDTDMFEAFAFIANEAINAKADVFLLVGDCFDKPQVEPRHLRQAQHVLTKLKQADIPVIIVEGNHDKISLNSTSTTWLDYLAEDNLVILLRTIFDSDGPHFTAWNDIYKTGSYIDLFGVRFVGAGYLGAATPYKVREIASKLEPGQLNVLLLHAGPDYFVGEGGGFSSSDLSFVRKRVKYLALGHIHKPMLYENWAYNAGSPENCELREATYDLNLYKNITKRGYAIIDINTNNQESPVHIMPCSNPRRPVHRITLDCTPFGKKLKDGAAMLIGSASALICANNLNSTSVIDLTLTGKINLNRIALDQTAAEIEIEQNTNVAAVAINVTKLILESTTTHKYSHHTYPNRKELEKIAILQILNHDHLFGIDDGDQDFAYLLQNLKDGISANWSTDKIAEYLHQSYLIDRILDSKIVE
jgi:DNA repair exonuclease SbcCD nuclease subunit